MISAQKVARAVPVEPTRDQLRQQSISWALASGGVSLLMALLISRLSPLAETTTVSTVGPALEASLRAGGCGLFYGLLAFHLQRVDPDDSHLQAGLVGALCGICSLVSPLGVTAGLSTVMMEALRGWLPLWLPLVGSALLLRVVSRGLRV
ncbi:MAG: hypothetical protein FJ050_07630 [Cyanobacteria bacterium M_surface_7_m2_040]|nr:hypothetical protein [Cyanobacteria bacterium M_surface_7_m2_040]